MKTTEKYVKKLIKNITNPKKTESIYRKLKEKEFTVKITQHI